MPSINHKRKSKTSMKSSKSSKRSKNVKRSKKTRSNIRKMRGGGGLKEDVMSYFEENNINIMDYSINLANKQQPDIIIINNKTIHLQAMGDIRQDLDLEATEDNPPTVSTKWVNIKFWTK